MKKAVLFLILMSVATCAFATTPKLARGVNFGELVAGTAVGVLTANALTQAFSRPAPVYSAYPAYRAYYVAPAPVYPVYPPSYQFNPYTQCYEPWY